MPRRARPRHVFPREKEWHALWVRPSFQSHADVLIIIAPKPLGNVKILQYSGKEGSVGGHCKAPNGESRVSLTFLY